MSSLVLNCFDMCVQAGVEREDGESTEVVKFQRGKPNKRTKSCYMESGEYITCILDKGGQGYVAKR